MIDSWKLNDPSGMCIRRWLEQLCVHIIKNNKDLDCEIVF